MTPVQHMSSDAPPVFESAIDVSGILTVRLNRPDRLNALTIGTYEGLRDVFRSAKDDGAILGVVLAGPAVGFARAGTSTPSSAAWSKCRRRTGWRFAG